MLRAVDSMARFSVANKAFKKNVIIKIALASLFVLMFVGLKFWDSNAPVSIHDWNIKEISEIKLTDPADFAFAVFGDNKGNVSFFEPLLRDIDRNKEIAFAIDVGDLVGDGKREQYRRFLNQVHENLKIPLLATIGNHDLNRGSGNYQEIFGPTYYAFQTGQAYFLLLDAITESGFDKAELSWLENELQKGQGFKARFVFMHVPPFDPRGNGFNKCLPEKDGNDLLDLFRRYKVTHVFASHLHGYYSGVWDGVPYTITGGGGAGLQGSDPQHFFHHYVKVHVNNEKVDMTIRRIDSQGVMANLFELMEDSILQWGSLIGACVSLLSLGLSLRSRGGS